MNTLKANSKKQLERDEGRKSVLYYDSLNVPSIGIGRNLRRGLAPDEIDYLFDNDFNDHLRDLLAAIPWASSLDEPRLGALLNMAFNLGVPKLCTFKEMLAALEEKRWVDAKNHALNSIWSSQVKGRAVRIAKQFETGEWQ